MSERQGGNDRAGGKARSMKVEEGQLLKAEVPPLGWPHARDFQEHLLCSCAIHIPLERFEDGMRTEGARQRVQAAGWRGSDSKGSNGREGYQVPEGRESVYVQ